MAMTYDDQGRWDEALGNYENALDIYRALGNRYGEATVLHNVGRLCAAQGRWSDAIGKYQQTLETVETLGGREWGDESVGSDEHGLCSSSAGQQGRWQFLASGRCLR